MSSCSAQQAKLDNFRSAEKYSDLKVRVKDQYFPCHRVILASASEYFDALLGGNFRERDAEEIVLHDDIDVETFKEVLGCIYHSHEYECKDTVSNIYKLLSASLFLRIHSLETKCVSYIVENVSSVRDHVQIFALARSLKITVLIDAVGDYVVENFDLFYDDEHLLELSFDDLSFLLNRWSRAELQFRYETLMFHLLIRWMRHAPVERRKYFMELIGAVDADEISSDYVKFMLRHVKNFAGLPNPERKQLLGKRKLDSALHSAHGNTDEDSKNRSLLKRIISEHFLGYEESSADDPETPASFHGPTFYENAPGLHVFVEYFHNRQSTKHAKILSCNKYHPKWVLSGETNAWNDCKYRWTGQQESENLLYCMEIYKNSRQRQRFCTYSSVNMKSASKVLAPPPITLESEKIVMCAIPRDNDIYLLDSQMSDGGFRPAANDQFSVEELNHGFYHYDCPVDKWFSAPPMAFKQFYPLLTADHNLMYSIGGWTERESSKILAQAFDYRAGKWMKLPSHSAHFDSVCESSRICTFKDKVFISDGVSILTFDTVAHKWEEINSPGEEYCSVIKHMLAYDNSSLLLLVDYHYGNQDDNSDYDIATYRPHSQDWHISEALNYAILEAVPAGCSDYRVDYKIRDMITCKL